MNTTALKALLTLALFAIILVTSAITFWDIPQQNAPHAGVSGSEMTAQDKIVFSLATSGNWSDSYQSTLVQEQIKALEESSDKHIRLRLYDRNQLGDDLRIVTGVQLGTIDIVSSVPSTQALAVPEAALMDTPGLFSSLEQFNALMAGEYRDVIQGYYNAAGLHLLTVYAYSYRQMSCKYPITRLADLRDLRIRIVENKYQEAYWKQLGATPIPYSFDELYFALSQDIVQAQENPVDILLSEKMMEVQNCIILTDHLPMIQVLAMNQARYEQLDEQTKARLNRFAENLRQSMIANMPTSEAIAVETLQSDYGMQLIKPEPSLKDAMRASNSAVLNMLREDLGAEKVDRFLAAVEEARRSVARQKER